MTAHSVFGLALVALLAQASVPGVTILEGFEGAWYLQETKVVSAIRSDIDLSLYIQARSSVLDVAAVPSIYGVARPVETSQFPVDGSEARAAVVRPFAGEVARRLTGAAPGSRQLELISMWESAPGAAAQRLRQHDVWRLTDNGGLDVHRPRSGLSGDSEVHYRFARRPRPKSVATFAAANDFRASMSALSTYMPEISRAMPDAAYSETLVPGARTFAAQLLHIASGLVNITGGLTDGTTVIDTAAEGRSKADILRILAESFEHASRIVSQVADADCDDRVPWGSRLLEDSTISKRQVLAVTRDHLAHHRGQVIVHLRLKGIEPPAYVGF